jgi:hypothetical protein
MEIKRTKKNSKNQMNTNMEGVSWQQGLNAYQSLLCNKSQQKYRKNNVDDTDR